MSYKVIIILLQEQFSYFYLLKKYLMQIKQIFLGLVIALTLNSCIDSVDGNGKVVKEKRTISSFNKIPTS